MKYKKYIFLLFLMISPFLKAMRGDGKIFSKQFESQVKELFNPRRQQEFESRSEKLLQRSREQEKALRNIAEFSSDQKSEKMLNENQEIVLKNREILTANTEEYYRLKDRAEEIIVVAEVIERDVSGRDSWVNQYKKLQTEAEEITKKIARIEQETESIENYSNKLGNQLAALKEERPSVALMASKAPIEEKNIQDFNNLVDIRFTKSAFASTARQTKRLLELNRLAYNMLDAAAERVSLLLPEANRSEFRKKIKDKFNLIMQTQESEQISSATKSALEDFKNEVQKDNSLVMDALNAENDKNAVSLIEKELSMLDKNNQYSKTLESIKAMNKGLGSKKTTIFLPETLTVKSVLNLGGIGG